MPDADVLARIEANAHAVMARGRTVVDLGALRAYFADADHYLLSGALPAAEPADWRGSVAALDEAFAARGRRPRVELLAERHPGLGPALSAAGYEHTAEAPAMALVAGGLRPAAAVPGVTYVELANGADDLLDRFLLMQSRAFGMDLGAADEGWRSMMSSGLADGSIRAGALLEGDAVVSGASLLQGAGAAELAGVATASEHRRRGLASDCCSRLLVGYFGAGHDLAWLSAAEGALGVYEVLGFLRVGTQQNYGRAQR